MWQLWQRLAGPHGMVATLVLVGVAGALLVGVCIYCVITGVEFSTFVREPAAIHNFPPLDGLLSHAGVMLWTATATVCLFGAFLLRRTAAPPAVPRCFLAIGLFNLVLGADDLLMGHEVLVPTTLGISEDVVYVIYAVVALAWLVSYRQIILAGSWGLLVVAVGFLGASVLIDVFYPFQWLHFLFEDGAKLMGLSVWASYFVAAVTGQLFPAPPARSASSADTTAHDGAVTGNQSFAPSDRTLPSTPGKAADTARASRHST
ncbi:MAG: hypothetical protein WD534_18475 [Phycisphaeraceae bacterium]